MDTSLRLTVTLSGLTRRELVLVAGIRGDVVDRVSVHLHTGLQVVSVASNRGPASAAAQHGKVTSLGPRLLLSGFGLACAISGSTGCGCAATCATAVPAGTDKW